MSKKKKKNRQDKYPNTDSFYFHNQNPKNYLTTGDCVYRAISLALEQSWEKTVMEMAALACKTGHCPNYKDGIDDYMKYKGWKKMKQPRKIDNTKYYGADFCSYLNDHFPDGNGISNIVANMPSHLVCIKFIEGKFKICDTWDSSKFGGTIGNYWIKE